MCIPQEGCAVSVAPTGGVILDDNVTVRSVIAHLPEHPCPWMVDNSYNSSCPMLPSNLAPLVTEVMELPSAPDPARVHVGEAFTLGGGGKPFARAVWFTPSTADAITGRPSGSHAAVAARLHHEWCTHAPQSHRGGGGGGGTQPARGMYTELGFGVMPGPGRGSVGASHARSVVPFVRNPPLSRALEPLLSEFMSDVSEVLHAMLPPDVLAAQGSECGACPESIQEVYQYPRMRRGVCTLHSHQVAMRSPIARGTSMADDDKHARLCASDLHVDTWDGGGDLGTCTVHTCAAATSAAPRGLDAEGERHLLLHRGLVAFPHREGGRGVLIRSMMPGWHCALLMRTSACLHGSVLLDDSNVAGFALQHLRMYRVLTYPLRRIERMLARVGDTPGMWDEIRDESDEWTRGRMRES